MGYISIALRAMVNVESLNGIETVGNLSESQNPLNISLTAICVLDGGIIGYLFQFQPLSSSLTSDGILDSTPFTLTTSSYE